MNVRHAVALALVVWYLMSPPFSKDQYGRQHANPSAPLTEWNFYHHYQENCCHIYDRAHALEFKTFDECENLRKGFYDAWFGTNGRSGVKDKLSRNSAFREGKSEVIKYENCVAGDDSRLKFQ